MLRVFGMRYKRENGSGFKNAVKVSAEAVGEGEALGAEIETS